MFWGFFFFYPAPLLSCLIAVMECTSGWSFISFLPGIYNSMNMCVFVWVLAFEASKTDLCIRQQRRGCAAFLSLIKSLFPSLLLNILHVFRIKIQWLFLIYFFLEDSLDFSLSGKHSSAFFFFSFFKCTFFLTLG